MNKKLVLLVILVWAVSFLIALVQGDENGNNCPGGEGTETSPCVIPSDRAITLETDKWYGAEDTPVFLFRWSGQNADYFTNTRLQRVEPVVTQNEVGQSFSVLNFAGEVRTITFYSQNSPDAPASSSGDSPTDEVLETVNIGGTDHQLTSNTAQSFSEDCQAVPASCTITDSNSYTHDLGEGHTETVTVNNNDIVIRQNSATNRVTINAEDNEFPMTSDQFDSIPSIGDETAITFDSNTNSLTFITGEESRTLTRTAWGYELSAEKNMETVYWVGSEIVSPDGEGNWVFGRETYTGSSLAENGDLTLGSGTRTVTVHSDDSGLSITERDGDETTITIQQEEGTTVEELEDDKLISRRHSGPGGLEWSDELDEGEFTGRIFYDDAGRRNGWCETSADQCAEPTVTFNWNGKNDDGEDCGVSNPECYSRGSIRASDLDQVPDEFEDQLETDPFGDIDAESILSGIVNHPVSFYPLANEWEIFDDYIEFWDAIFARDILRIEPFTSLLCEENFDVDPTEGIGIIRTPQGTFQAAAHVVAERISVGPLLCDDEGVCPADLECREDQFCYREGENKPTIGYLYKIDWGVTAPSDEGRIGARGIGDEIKFNLVAYKDTVPFFLFGDAAGRAREITLEKGERTSPTYKPLIVEYFPEEFTRFCIEWSDDENFVPQTESLELFGSFGLEPLPDICSDIVETRPGRTLESATDPTGVSQSGQIHYCTLSGCS